MQYKVIEPLGKIAWNDRYIFQFTFRGFCWRFYPNRLTESFSPPFTHRRQSQPRRARARSSGAVRVRRLAQGHIDSQLGGAEDLTSNLAATNEPALPPELLLPIHECRWGINQPVNQPPLQGCYAQSSFWPFNGVGYAASGWTVEAVQNACLCVYSLGLVWAVGSDCLSTPLPCPSVHSPLSPWKCIINTHAGSSHHPPVSVASHMWELTHTLLKG